MDERLAGLQLSPSEWRTVRLALSAYCDALEAQGEGDTERAIQAFEVWRYIAALGVDYEPQG